MAKKAGKKRVYPASVSAKPVEPSSEELWHSYMILCDGTDSVNSLASLYQAAQKARGGGAPTHEEQDLLRAMVVMAGATLDATLKRLIRDAFLKLIKCNPKALEEAQKHVKRRIVNDLEKRGGERLSRILLSDSPKAELIGFIIDDTTGDSLQSKDEVEKVVQLLGLEKCALEGLREAFVMRNQIIHEMDSVTSPGKGEKRRRQRKKTEMYTSARNLLSAAADVLGKVDKHLASIA